MEDIVVQSGGHPGIARGKVKCDCFDYLDHKTEAPVREYMRQYSLVFILNYFIGYTILMYLEELLQHGAVLLPGIKGATGVVCLRGFSARHTNTLPPT